MGIMGAILAVLEFLSKALDMVSYWLNPKERKRRRKQKGLNDLYELQSKRDAIFRKGAINGFTPEIDYQLAQIEEQINRLADEIRAKQ